VDNILRELRKLVSPLESKIDDEFKIYTKFNDFHIGEYKNKEIRIEPFPIVDMYNYRLKGEIDATGKANLVYENTYNDSKIVFKDHHIHLNNDEEDYCGQIKLDLRVFDKDDEGINTLINNLSKGNPTESIGTRFAKQLLKESTGVGIFRNGFRIRPHGDPGFDWLNLDNRRVQNPSQRIGLDQIVGFISVESEEYSYLEEKSARDGIKESSYYSGLIKIIEKSLNELEKERFIYRQIKTKEKKSKSSSDMSHVDNLFDLSDFNTSVSDNVERGLKKIEDNPEKAKEYAREITESVTKSIQNLERKKSEEYDRVKKIMAIYQGQATLGKIVTVILHEGRKSEGWFTNQLTRIITVCFNESGAHFRIEIKANSNNSW